eukprot:m51a1_g1512 putative dtdp-glucose -dehydratase (380) ;mRNA; r:407899-409652
MSTRGGSERSPRSVLVTGGAGFIGSNLVRHLLASDPALLVTSYDAMTYAASARSHAGLAEEYGRRYALVAGDVRDGAALRAALASRGVDSVVHLAAESHVDRSIDGPLAFVRTNVEGTACLLEALRSEWRNAPPGSTLLHHVSTDEVYGSLAPDAAPVAPGAPFDPSSPYSASKAAADCLVRAWGRTYGLAATIGAATNNYGPYQFPEKLIPLLVVRALRGEELPVYGDGRQVRDWLHVRDHCRGIEAALRRGVAGAVYHFSGGAANEWENVRVVSRVCDALDALRPRAAGGSYAELVRHVRDRPGHDRRYALDAARARDELGWEPLMGAHEGIGQTVQWYLDNWEWVEDILSGRYHCERLGLLEQLTPRESSPKAAAQ